MSDSCGKAWKLPTPLAKRPAQPAVIDNGLRDIKRSRLDLNHDNNFANRRHMRRSKSVTSLSTEVQAFRNESNDNFERPGATTRALACWEPKAEHATRLVTEWTGANSSVVAVAIRLSSAKPPKSATANLFGAAKLFVKTALITKKNISAIKT